MGISVIWKMNCSECGHQHVHTHDCNSRTGYEIGATYKRTKKTKWHKCSVDEPPHDKPIQICIKHKITGERSVWGGILVSNGGWKVGITYLDKYYEVTHWKEMAKLPKED